MKKNKGVTLISLVTTIVVLLILASITVYGGVNTLRSAKYYKAVQEMKLVQAKVDDIYEEYKLLNDTEKEEYLNENSCNISAETQTKARNVCVNIYDYFKDKNGEDFANEKIGDLSDFIYWSKDFLKDKLGIDGVKSAYAINLDTRAVIRVTGVKYDGEYYHTLYQIEGEQYNTGELDTTKPQITDVTSSIENASTCKIRVTGNDSTGYGIDSVYCCKKTDEPSDIKTVADSVWKSISSNTFELLDKEETTTYCIWLKDKAGNISESKEVTTQTINYVTDSPSMGYETLENAVNGADYNATITMIKDCTDTSAPTITRDVTLDINGKTLTKLTNSVVVNNPQNDGGVNFTLKGSGNIEINEELYLFINKGGVMNVEYTGSVSNNNSELGGIIFKNYGILNIQDGKYTLSNGHPIENWNTLYITGGTYSIGKAGAVILTEGGTANISNATITADQNDTDEDSYAIVSRNNSSNDEFISHVYVNNSTINYGIIMTGLTHEHCGTIEFTDCKIKNVIISTNSKIEGIADDKSTRSAIILWDNKELSVKDFRGNNIYVIKRNYTASDPNYEIWSFNTSAKIEFPTWNNVKNVPNWLSGEADNTTYGETTYHIKIKKSDFGNQTGYHYTHIYDYDSSAGKKKFLYGFTFTMP